MRILLSNDDGYFAPGLAALHEGLASLGEIIEYRGERVTLRVPRSQLAERTSELLARFPVDDLAVDEPDVEEVIRKVFSE